jgi:hypothetical protein
MTDTVSKIRKCFGPVPRQLAYEACNVIELLESQIDNLNGHRAADRDEAAMERELAGKLIMAKDKDIIELEQQLAEAREELSSKTLRPGMCCLHHQNKAEQKEDGDE